MINILRALKATTCKNRWIGREMEILKNLKEMLEIKNTVTELKNAFDGLQYTRHDKKESGNMKVSVEISKSDR